MKKRIFVAVDISEAARRKIAAYVNDLRNEFGEVRANWEKPEKLHLTLKFFGDTDESHLAEIGKIVEAIAKQMNKFTLQLANKGVFPNQKNARVLWIGIDDANNNLVKINNLLELEVSKIEFTNEKRRYKPHLTIARLKDSKNAEQLVNKFLQTQFEPLEFEVSEIVIYQSKLQTSGSIYKKVRIFKLKS